MEIVLKNEDSSFSTRLVAYIGHPVTITCRALVIKHDEFCSQAKEATEDISGILLDISDGFVRIFSTKASNCEVLINKIIECKIYDKVEKADKKVEPDMVNHPNHYQSETGLEVIDAIEAFTFDLTGIEAVCTGNVLKYICRWKKKNGLEDLKKAQWYLERLIRHVKLLEKENG